MASLSKVRGPFYPTDNGCARLTKSAIAKGCDEVGNQTSLTEFVYLTKIGIDT